MGSFMFSCFFSCSVLILFQWGQTEQIPFQFFSVKTCFVSCYMEYSRKTPQIAEKNLYSEVFEMDCSVNAYSLQLIYNVTYFWCFSIFLMRQSVGDSRVLKSPTIIVLELICDFISSSICFIKIKAPIFGASIFRSSVFFRWRGFLNQNWVTLFWNQISEQWHMLVILFS